MVHFDLFANIWCAAFCRCEVQALQIASNLKFLSDTSETCCTHTDKVWSRLMDCYLEPRTILSWQKGGATATGLQGSHNHQNTFNLSLVSSKLHRSPIVQKFGILLLFRSVAKVRMSFGFSVGDFLAVGQLSWKVYKKCKDSPGKYKELSTEVGALHNVMKETEELLSQQNLNRQQENRLLECQQGCEDILKNLDRLLVKY